MTLSRSLTFRLAAVVVSTLSGCSFAFVKPAPPGWQNDHAPFACTSGAGWPALDVVGILLGASMMPDDSDRNRSGNGNAAATLTGLAVMGVAAAGAIYGTNRVFECRSALREADARVARRNQALLEKQRLAQAPTFRLPPPPGAAPDGPPRGEPGDDADSGAFAAEPSGAPPPVVAPAPIIVKRPAPRPVPYVPPPPLNPRRTHVGIDARVGGLVTVGAPDGTPEVLPLANLGLFLQTPSLSLSFFGDWARSETKGSRSVGVGAYLPIHVSPDDLREVYVGAAIKATEQVWGGRGGSGAAVQPAVGYRMYFAQGTVGLRFELAYLYSFFTEASSAEVLRPVLVDRHRGQGLLFSLGIASR